MKKLFIIFLLVSFLSPVGCDRSDDRHNQLSGITGDIISRSLSIHEVYVRQPADGGDDNNPGTMDLPKATIQCAIDAVSSDETGKIYVAAGSYQVSQPVTFSNSGRFVLKGGYNPTDWNDRKLEVPNPSGYLTTISQGADFSGDCTVKIMNNTSSSIEGFSITSHENYAVLVQNTRFNIAYSDIQAYQSNSTSVSIDNSQGRVYENLISGNNASASITTTVLELTNDSYIIALNNTIYGGAGQVVMGMALYDSTAIIYSNDITGGNPGSDNSIGIYISGTYSTGPQERPVEIYNNNLHQYNSKISSVSIQNYNSDLIIKNNTHISGIISRMGNVTIEENDDISAGKHTSTISFAIHITDDSFHNVKISHNKITGAGAGQYSLDYQTAVYLKDSDAEVSGNEINGGSNRISSTGIKLINSNAQLFNNTINGGRLTDKATAVYNFNSSSSIINNTICCGINSDAVYGIINYYNSNSVIKNNIIFLAKSYIDPLKVYGITNDFLSIPAVSYNDIWLEKDMGLNYVGKNGNINIDPVFEELFTDWHLTSGSPMEVTAGGLEDTITDIDKDGTIRTIPWSIGAYESDF